ncbi:hypothetical protein TMatcc_003481 [Talaromyces marneffei ATCC 18224]
MPVDCYGSSSATSTWRASKGDISGPTPGEVIPVVATDADLCRASSGGECGRLTSCSSTLKALSGMPESVIDSCPVTGGDPRGIM